MMPLLPKLAVPVLITTTPLTPDIPAFAVDISIDPLDDIDPNPDTIEIFPPTLDDDLPDTTDISPPLPLSPDPTLTYIRPP
jgi:hypothetical protein